MRERAQESHSAPEELSVLQDRKGAQVGDLYTSLIHTCELNGANPFDYLTVLQRHSAELAGNPAAPRMPWSYGQTLGRADARVDSGRQVLF